MIVAPTSATSIASNAAMHTGKIHTLSTAHQLAVCSRCRMSLTNIRT